MTECRTVTVSLLRPPAEVYDYLLNPANFPQWSAFITEIVPEDNAWRARTPQGTLRIHFVARNDHRVLDHTVTTADGTQIYVPMRVLANGADGSEVVLSVFRQPEMTDEEFAADVALVTNDFTSLKRVLEA